MSKKVRAIPGEPQLKTRSSDPTNLIVLQVRVDAKTVIKKSRPGRKPPPKAIIYNVTAWYGLVPTRLDRRARASPSETRRKGRRSGHRPDSPVYFSPVDVALGEGDDPLSLSSTDMLSVLTRNAQRSAVSAAADGKLGRRGVLVGNQPLRRCDEVVEAILLLELLARSCHSLPYSPPPRMLAMPAVVPVSPPLPTPVASS